MCTKWACLLPEGELCHNSKGNVLSGAPRVFMLSFHRSLPSVKSSRSKTGAKLKRWAVCFYFPSFGFWRAQERVLRLSHSLLLVTAFCVFVWVPVRLKLYTWPSSFPYTHQKCLMSSSFKFWAAHVFWMTHATSSCCTNPKIHLWPTHTAENNFHSEPVNRKQPQVPRMWVELHCNSLDPSTTATTTTQHVVCRLCSSSTTWLAAPSPTSLKTSSTLLSTVGCQTRGWAAGWGGGGVDVWRSRRREGRVFVGVD